jgi:hypothetical protein
MTTRLVEREGLVEGQLDDGPIRGPGPAGGGDGLAVEAGDGRLDLVAGQRAGEPVTRPC